MFSVDIHSTLRLKSRKKSCRIVVPALEIYCGSSFKDTILCNSSIYPKNFMSQFSDGESGSGSQILQTEAAVYSQCTKQTT